MNYHLPNTKKQNWQLPKSKSNTAKVFKMPHQKQGIQIDYNFNLLPIGTSQLWDKTSLYNTAKTKPLMAGWLLNS